jgi:hypothetical protein
VIPTRWATSKDERNRPRADLFDCECCRAGPVKVLWHHSAERDSPSAALEPHEMTERNVVRHIILISNLLENS